LIYEFSKFWAEISAPGAWKTKKLKKNGFFEIQYTVFSKALAIFFVFHVHNLYSHQKKSSWRIQYHPDANSKPGWSWQCLWARWKKMFFLIFFFWNFDLKKCVFIFLTTFVLRLFMYFSFSGSKRQKSQLFERIFCLLKIWAFMKLWTWKTKKIARAFEKQFIVFQKTVKKSIFLWFFGLSSSGRWYLRPEFQKLVEQKLFAIIKGNFFALAVKRIREKTKNQPP
jgi:hypothetical protein